MDLVAVSLEALDEALQPRMTAPRTLGLVATAEQLRTDLNPVLAEVGARTAAGATVDRRGLLRGGVASPER